MATAHGDARTQGGEDGRPQQRRGWSWGSGANRAEIKGGAEPKGVWGREQQDGVPVSHHGTLRRLLRCRRVSPSSPRSPAGTGLRARGNDGVSGGG